MSLTAQLVDSMSDTAAVRLDLNDGAVWSVIAKGTSTPPPPLRRVVASTPLTDGDRHAAATYGNRTVILALNLLADDLDQAAAHVQALTRELHRTQGFLRWRPHTTLPVYFRLVRGEYADVQWDGVSRRVTVRLPADPYAHGPEEHPLPAGLVVSDTFNRPAEVAGWGPAWLVDESPAAQFSTNGVAGVHTVNAVAAYRSRLAGVSVRDCDVRYLVNFPVSPTGEHIRTEALVRYVDAANHVAVRALINVGNIIDLQIVSVVNGVETVAGVNTGVNHIAGVSLLLHVQAIGGAVQASVWRDGTTEPPSWQNTATDPVPQAGTVAARTLFAPGNTNALPVAVLYDNLTVTEIVGVVNDPTGVPGPPLNANPFFEADVANWTAFSGTAVRSTVQAHQGVASLLVTPDGVAVVQETTSDTVPIVAGRAYRLSGWVRCAVARTIDIFAVWQNIGGGETGSPVLGVAVAANTWTFLDHTVTAPAGTNAARLSFRMTGTPPAGHTLHIDEAMLREDSGPGSMYVDITGVRGDVETPMVLRADQSDVNGVAQTAIGIRRAANVADTPFVSQAEAWTLLTDTTLQAGDPTASGAGQNFVRCSFGTNAAMVDRMTVTHPAVPTDATRGLYRVFVRVRRSSAVGDTTIRVQLRRPGVTNEAATVALSTAWQWVDLGYVPIPGGADQASDFAGRPIGAGSVALWLQADRVGPSAVSLDADVSAFVPADDGFALVAWSGHGPTGWTVLDGAQDIAYALDSAGRVTPANPAPVAVPGVPMLAPGVTNRVYVVKRALGGADTLAEAVRLDVSYYPRYLFVRPLAG